MSATGSTIAVGSRDRARLRAYLTLVKARLSALVLLTTAVGFVLGIEAGPGPGSVLPASALLAWTLLGTALAAASANALNQVLEIRRDALMHRTADRPLPAGRLGPRHAVVVAIVLGGAGVGMLAIAVNAASAALALLTILIYVLVYTPLKTRSTLNTLVGAVCGAIPPMIGWVAATGTPGAGGWALAALLFVWQIPHFLALAWLYRDDYARGRFRMLPVLDTSGRVTCQIVLLTSLMLVPVALTVTLLGLAGWVFAAGAVAFGLWMGSKGARLLRERTDANARRVFLASLVYLTAILLLLVIDRGPLEPPDVIHRVAAAAPLGE